MSKYSREIALDTETTGLDPRQGHRIVEIGCVEMINRVRTGEVFHVYINPERDMPQGAFAVHGLSEEFLADKPLFTDIVDNFLAFIKSDPLVIHNAAFDIKFLNHELSRVKKSEIPMLRATDTLYIARKKFPGAQASLGALCKRFSIDLSQRTKHGALLDAELLADVYVELMGGRQRTLLLDPEKMGTLAEASTPVQVIEKLLRPARPIYTLTDEEVALHTAFCAKLSGSTW